MAKKSRATKQVIRAISLGISAAMMLQPVAALADELDNENLNALQDANTSVLDEDTNNDEDNSVQSTQVTGPSYETMTDVAEDSLDNATKSEFKEDITAVLTIGSGVITAETQAIIADAKAKEHVEDAEEAYVDGEQAVENALAGKDKKGNTIEGNSEATFDELIDSVSDNSYIAATEAEKALDASGNAYEALEKVENATTSAEATELSKDVSSNAVDAQNSADIAKEAADDAKKAYDEALARYQAAVAEADAATKAANDAAALGLEDANDAVAKAQIALDRAKAIKAETEAAAKKAGENLADKQLALTSAQQDLVEATLKLAQEGTEELAKASVAITTGVALTKAGAALEAAKKLEAVAQKNYDDKVQAVKDLEQAKKDAEDEIAKAEAEVKRLEEIYGAESAEAKAAAEALTAANTALGEANAALESAKKNVKDTEDALAELTDTDYEKAVVALEEKIAEANASENKSITVGEGDEAVTLTYKDLQEQLVKVVIDEKLGESTYNGTDSNGNAVYAVTKDGDTKYYSYEITDEGQINVYENDLRTWKEYKGEVNEYSSASDFQAAVEGKTEGKEYKVDHVEAVEAEYTITYDIQVKTHEKDTEREVTVEEMNKTNGNLPDGAYIEVRKWSGTYHFRWDSVAGKWKCTSWNTGYLNSDDNGRTYLCYGKDVYETTTSTAYNVKESEISSYTNATVGEKTKEGVAEKWTVKTLDIKSTLTNVSDYSEAVEGLTEGTDYYVVQTGEAYAGTYTATKSTVDKKEGQDLSTYDSYVADGYTVTWHGNPVSKEGDWLVTTDDNGDKKYLNSFFNHIDVSKTIVDEITIPASEKDKYENDGYTLTFDNNATSTTYNVYFYDVVNHSEYTLTDSDADGSQSNITAQKNSLNVTLETQKAAVTTAAQSVSDNDAKVKTAKEELEAAKKDEETAKANYDAAVTKRDELQTAYSAYYENGWKGPLTGEYHDTSYEKDLNAAKVEVAEAWIALETAKTNTAIMQKAYDKAKELHEEALSNLKSQTQELVNAAVKEGESAVVFLGKAFDLAGAKIAYDALKTADNYAAKVLENANKAYGKAVEARGYVAALQGKANVSKEELALAYYKLNIADSQWKKAEEDAKTAQDAADAALEAYKAALEKIADLMAAEEEARRNSATDDDNDDDYVAPVVAEETPELPGTPNAPRVRRASTTPAVVAEVEEVAEAEEVVIAEEETPLAAAVEEVAAPEVTIADEDTPLAVMDEQQMSWWWILLVLVLGTTGAELYRRHMIKKNASKVEKTEE